MTHITFIYPTFGSPLVSGLEKAFGDELGECRFTHLGEGRVLRDVRDAGLLTPAVRERLVGLFGCAVTSAPDIIVCTCSSIGTAAESAASAHPDVPIIRIDDAMARHAVAHHDRIGVMGTLATTMDPSCELVARIAREAGRPVEVMPRLATGAFEAQEAGRREDAEEMMERTALALAAEGAEIILLAQASMASMQDRLAETTGIPVLSSPALCASQTRQILEAVS